MITKQVLVCMTKTLIKIVVEKIFNILKKLNIMLLSAVNISL